VGHNVDIKLLDCTEERASQCVFPLLGNFVLAIFLHAHQNTMKIILKAKGIVQMVEHFCSMCESLGSICSTGKKDDTICPNASNN
jgi:hypothetical protein